MSAWLAIALLVLAQIPAARGLSRLSPGRGRLGTWMVMLPAVAGAERMLAEAGPIARMTGICLVLLAGMKSVIYVEWANGGTTGRRSLPPARHLGFALFWFGMNPGLFALPRRRLPARRMIAEGAGMMLAGTLLAAAVHSAGWESVWAMFIPMSVGFHFGALRVLAGLWRRAGIPVKPLFRNPFTALNPAEFWAKRWNLGYSQMMGLAVGRPLEHVMGKKAAFFGVFVVSGLLHELAISLPVRGGYGLPTLCFTLFGAMALLDFPRWPALPRRLATVLSIVLPLPLLFPEPFQSQVMRPLLGLVPALFAYQP